jgi:hypothetical protein
MDQPATPAAQRRRHRPRRSLTLAPATLARLTERAAASGQGLGREVDYAVREADGDHGRLRHAVAGDLMPVLFECSRIRDVTRHPEVVSAVGVIEAAVRAAKATLARPAGGG